MFDVAIAYIAVIVVLSTIVTGILEVVQRVLPLRYAWLWWCVHKVLAAVKVSPWSERRRLWKDFRQDALVNPGDRRFLDHVDDDALRAWLARLPEKSPGLALPVWLEDDQLFRTWVDGFNDAATRGYKALMVGLAFAIGYALAWAAGLDGVGLAQHLKRQPDLAASLALVAAEGDDLETKRDEVESVDRYLALLREAIQARVGCLGLADDACAQRHQALLKEARQVLEESDPDSWDQAADRVEEHFFSLKLARERGGEPAAWLQAARAAAEAASQSAPAADGDRRWLGEATATALLAHASGEPIDDPALLFHLWTQCRQSCPAEGTCLQDARACFGAWLGGEADAPFAAPSPDCSACAGAVDHEVDRILLHARSGWPPPDWQLALLDDFDARAALLGPGPAAHRWLADILDDLDEDDGPVGLLAALDAPELRRASANDAASLAGALAAAEATRTRMDVLSQDLVGFSGVWLAPKLWMRAVGYSLIAVLVALGAPFWFDLLSRFQRVRQLRRPDTSPPAKEPSVIGTDG